MIDDELSANRRIIDGLFIHAQRRDALGFLSLYAADARLIDPVLGCLSGSRLTTFLHRLFATLRQFDAEYAVEDVGLRSSRIRVTLRARRENARKRERLEVEAHLITRDGIIVSHEVEFDIARWARIMLPGEKCGWRIYPGWRRRLADIAGRHFLERSNRRAECTLTLNGSMPALIRASALAFVALGLIVIKTAH